MIIPKFSKGVPVFVEPVSDSELLILYNDAKYDNGDGTQHKATMVKRVRLIMCYTR